MARDKYLSIYLNDHLAEVETELEDSRATLLRAMDDLGTRRDPFKRVAAWAEKLGRLKLNGHLLSYSPLSRVLELEGLVAGAELEARTWEAVGPRAGLDVSPLLERCERRRHELVRHHGGAVTTALG